MPVKVVEPTMDDLLDLLLGWSAQELTYVQAFIIVRWNTHDFKYTSETYVARCLDIIHTGGATAEGQVREGHVFSRKIRNQGTAFRLS